VTLWLSVLTVTVFTWAMRASGPLALGDRHLPAVAIRVTTLLAPVLLADLIVVDLGGAKWGEFDWRQMLGVGVAGLARILKAPMLLAVFCGITAAAILRLLTS
jgi:branched-subunit amino acid transport protein